MATTKTFLASNFFVFVCLFVCFSLYYVCNGIVCAWRWYLMVLLVLFLFFLDWMDIRMRKKKRKKKEVFFLSFSFFFLRNARCPRCGVFFLAPRLVRLCGCVLCIRIVCGFGRWSSIFDVLFLFCFFFPFFLSFFCFFFLSLSPLFLVF
jgi:hypothetical protein